MSPRVPAKRWAGNELREAALSAAGDPRYWSTPAGAALLVQLERFVSPHVARQVRSKMKYSLEADEVTNTIIVQMASQESFVRGLRKAMNPWGYLAECARRWSHTQAGHRMLELDGMPGMDPAGAGLEERYDPESGLTPLREVVASTVTTLLLYLGEDSTPNLAALVEWFALNPPQHQGHGHTDARRAGELSELGFTSEQIGAVANVTWGGRPNQRATSLFYGYLLDAGFEPAASSTHRAALNNVRRVFARETVSGGKR